MGLLPENLLQVQDARVLARLELGNAPSSSQAAASGRGGLRCAPARRRFPAFGSADCGRRRLPWGRRGQGRPGGAATPDGGARRGQESALYRGRPGRSKFSFAGCLLGPAAPAANRTHDDPAAHPDRRRLELQEGRVPEAPTSWATAMIYRGTPPTSRSSASTRGVGGVVHRQYPANNRDGQAQTRK